MVECRRWQIGILLISASCLSIQCFSQSLESRSQPRQKTLNDWYYKDVDIRSPGSLRQSLHDVIDDHVRIPYTSMSLDTWDVLELADEDPRSSLSILDTYKNESYPKFGGGNNLYNREHVWPKSYGFADDNGGNYPFTDCHNLRLSDSGYNASRGAKPFRFCDALCNEHPTVTGGGVGGGSGIYPGNSNWSMGSGETGTWEGWVDRRGDLARSVFYMDVRYEGGFHGGTGDWEPDLIVTDDSTLIQSFPDNRTIAFMGYLADLIVWHFEDPPDDKERLRNEIVHLFQGNRNPFVDHPEWVQCLYGAACGSSMAPMPPSGLIALPGDQVITLDWNDNQEPDICGYNLFRSTTTGGPYDQVNQGLIQPSEATDSSVTNGITYYYRVTAVNDSSVESSMSAEVHTTPSSGDPVDVPWINEFHYDNSGQDAGEFCEIAGRAGTDLQGFQLVAYNGNGGDVYDAIPLVGVIPNLAQGFGVLAFDIPGLQNGSPDGLALVDAQQRVLEFISYEGTFIATSGPAMGMISSDIMVAETSSTPLGWSLQLSGTGDEGGQFQWDPPGTATPGTVNTDQVFVDGGA